MTGKTILILTSILILGVLAVGLSFDNAEAKKVDILDPPQVGDEVEIKGKGTGTCTSDDDTVTAKANARFLLLVTETNGEDFSGSGKVKIQLITKCDGAPKKLVNNGPVAHAYDGSSGILSIAGDLVDDLGNTYSLDAIGQVNEGKKTTIDLIMQLVGDNGIVIDVTVTA